MKSQEITGIILGCETYTQYHWSAPENDSHFLTEHSGNVNLSFFQHENQILELGLE